MARLDDMRVVAQLAESGSISAAAKALGMPKQTFSRRLAELEDELGVELARRTTRAITLTAVGRAYAARCAEVVRLADDANRAVSSQLDEVGGTLRVTADTSFGEAFLPELVATYLDLHPRVRVEVLLTSRKVDVLDEGFDVAFRIGPPPDVLHLAATRLGPARLWTVASPAYLAARGEPETPDDLREHDCLSAVPTLAHAQWPLMIDGALQLIGVRSRLRVNGLAMARRAALAGIGVAQLPEFAVAADVEDGALVEVLGAFAPEVGGIHVVYPCSRLLAPAVTEFVATAVALSRGAPR